MVSELAHHFFCFILLAKISHKAEPRIRVRKCRMAMSMNIVTRALRQSRPWSRKWPQPTPASSPGKFHGQRSLVVYSP